MRADDLKPYIEALKRREITGREVARRLGTHETYISRMLARMGVEREEIIKPPSTKELRAARAEHRLHVALTLDIKAAAKAAGCSERTIYRIKASAHAKNT